MHPFGAEAQLAEFVATGHNLQPLAFQRKPQFFG
jgi:hypothetical protein